MADFKVNISFTMVGPEQLDADPSLAPIFFLHGIAASKETWDKCLKPFANGTGRRVVTYDARNHGDSGWSKDCSYESMIQDLECLMQYLHSPKIILVGHCMGGKTAMEFALKHPDKVEKLIVEDMSLRYFPEAERNFALKYMNLLKESLGHIPSDCKDIPNAQRFLAKYIHQKMPEELRGDKHAEIDPASLAIEIDPTTGNFEWKINLTRLEHAVLHAFQAEPYVEGFQVVKYEGVYNGPTLFLCGAKSPYKVHEGPEDLKFIQKYMPKAGITFLDGAGHLVHADYPEAFCEEAVLFINDP